ncbi:MAG: hypothetical protein R3E88_05115 [Myxococcota bacterium]
MSVRGEFQRVLGDCLALLDAAPSSGTWRAALARAGERVAEGASPRSLVAAAEEVLALGDAAPPHAFATEADSRAFAERLEHLRAICRVVVGR